MSLYEEDRFEGSGRDDSLVALLKKILRQEEEKEIPIEDIMDRKIPYATSGSRGRRVRAPRKKVMWNRIGHTGAEVSQKKVGRPKSKVKRCKFQTTVAPQTRDILRDRGIRWSHFLESWIRTLTDKED